MYFAGVGLLEGIFIFLGAESVEIPQHFVFGLYPWEVTAFVDRVLFSISILFWIFYFSMSSRDFFERDIRWSKLTHLVGEKSSLEMSPAVCGREYS